MPTNTAQPTDSARERLKRTLAPGQTLYLIQRHVSRRHTHIEVSVFVMPVQDISDDVAQALGCVYGIHGGAILRTDPATDSGVYLAGWLSELCGFGADPIRYRWL